MKVVKLDQAAPGYTLARDVVDLRGNMLFRAGTQLSETAIDLLRARGITHLILEAVSAPEASLPAPARPSAAEIDREIDELFSDVADQPTFHALREAARRYRKGRES